MKISVVRERSNIFHLYSSKLIKNGTDIMMQYLKLESFCKKSWIFHKLSISKCVQFLLKILRKTGI